MAFPFDVNVNYNPGNAITGLNQFNNLLATTAGALSKLAAAGNIPMQGIDNFIASAARGATASSTLGSAALKITNSLAGINSGAQQAGAGLTDLGGKAQAASSSIQNVSSVTKNLGPAFQVVAGAVLQTGGSFNTMGTQAQGAVAKLIGMGGALRNLEGIVATTSAQMRILSPVVTQTSQAFSAGLAPSLAAGVAPLTNLNSQLGTTTSGLNNVGGAATTSATGFGRLREMFTGNRGLVFGMSAFFGTLTGIAFELQLVGDANKQVAESQGQVNALIAAGKEGTGQYSQAVQALGKDQRFLEFSSRNLALAFTNLIPDVLLVTNGIIQLTDKFSKTGAAAATATAGLTTVANGMTTAATSTAVLNTAQTTLGTGFTNSANAMKTIVPVLTATRAEQAGLILTTNGLTAAQTGMVAKTVLSRDALAAMQGVMAATRGEELGLIATTDALGNSFLSMGKKVGAAEGGVGAGGIKGAIGKLLGGLGIGGGAGLGGAASILGPLAAVAAVPIFYEFVLKPGAEATSQRILAEGQKLDAMNKSIGSSSDALAAKIQAGTASQSDYWNAYADAVNTAGNKIIAKQAEVAKGAPGAVTAPAPGMDPNDPGNAAYWENQGKGNEVFPDFGKQGTVVPSSGPVGTGKGGAFSNFGTGQTQQTAPLGQYYTGNTPPRGYIYPSGAVQGAGYLGPTTVTPPKGGGANLQTPQQIMAAMETDLAMQQVKANMAGQIDLGAAGKFKLGHDITRPELVDLQAAGEEITGIAGGKKPGVSLSTDEMKKIQDAKEKILKITQDTAPADKAAADAAKELADAQANVGKAVTGTQASLEKHNQAVLAMPRALAAATGQELEYSRTVQTGMGTVTVYDLKLMEHIKTTQQQAAAYTSLSAIQNESLQVQEQVVAVGNEIIGGAEQQADAIRGVNIFWNEMSTSMQGSLLASQQLSIASVDVTRSLTNQTEHQFLVNEGLISGAQAAQEFLQKSIVGAAANDAYAAGITKIATEMGILPKNITLTAEELSTLIDDFNQTGSTAASLAAVLATRLAPAFDLFNKAFTADSMKEMGKAMKDLPGFDDLSKSVRKAMLDIGGEFQKVHQRALEFNTDVQTLVIGAFAGADKFSGSQLHSTFESLVKDFDSISKINPNVAQFDPLMKFLGNLSGTELRAGIMKLSPLLNDLSTAMQDPASTAETFNAIIVKHSQLLADLGIQLDPLPSKYDATANSISNLQLKLSAFKPDKGFMTALDLITGKVTQIPKVELTKDEKKDMKDLKKEHKGERGMGEGGLGGPFSGDVPSPDKPPPTPPGGPGSIESRFQKISDATKGPPAPDIKPFQQAQTQITNIMTNITKAVGTMVVTVVKEFATMGVGVVKVMGTMVVSVVKEISTMDVAAVKNIGTMNVSVIKGMSTMVVSVIKTVGTMVTSTVAAFSLMATGSMKQVEIMGVNIIKDGTLLMKGWGISIVTLAADTITAFATMSKMSQTEVSNMYTAITDIAKQLDTDVVAEMQLMDTDSVAAVVTMSKDIQTEVSNLYTFTTDVFKTMDTDVVSSIEDMAKRGGSAASSFASDMKSSMGTVETAASDAASAVSNLADEVAALDGSSAVVTVTTNFKTTGTPPKQTGDVTINRLMGAVIDAASAKSFQYGGSIETSHGPQMAIYGDNPGGQETVAFIPHDNPFPTLKKLAKLFKGGGSTAEVMGRGSGGSEEIVINATFIIENIMDSQKVGTQIVKRTFRKMRTR
jgi:hypothetical protein